MLRSWIHCIINYYLTRETVCVKSAGMYDVLLKLMKSPCLCFGALPPFKSESKMTLIFGTKESERIFVAKPKH